MSAASAVRSGGRTGEAPLLMASLHFDVRAPYCGVSGKGGLFLFSFFFLISLREVSQKQLLRVAKFRRRKLWLCRPDRNLFVSVTMTRTASSGRQLYLRPEVFDIFSSYESLVFSPRDSLRIPWAKNTERQKQNNVKKKKIFFINIS